MADTMNRDGVKFDSCPHCIKITQARAKALPDMIHETPRAIVVAGDHQFFPGYCIVIAKQHVREMHHMPSELALALFGDVLEVGRVIQSHFGCLKMNYASLGNIHEHLHWHVIPRYSSDPDHKDHPWKNSSLFSNYPTSEEAIARLRTMFCGS